MYPFIYSALLLPVMGEEKEEGFIQSIGKHLVDRLVSLRGNHHSQGAQLLRGLSVLCECQGAPIQQNQSEFMNDRNDKLFLSCLSHYMHSSNFGIPSMCFST